MLACVMVGTHDLNRTIRLDDAALAPLGLVRTEAESDLVGDAPKRASGKIEFYVTTPYNRTPVSARWPVQSPYLDTAIGRVRFNMAGEWARSRLSLVSSGGDRHECKSVDSPIYDPQQKFARGLEKSIP